VFYLYLLWEINGPLYRAAKSHFEGIGSIEGDA